MSKLSLRRRIWIYICTPFICVLTAIFIPIVFSWQMIRAAWEIAAAMIEKYTR